MGTVVQLDTAPSLKKYWRQKIADLIKESGIDWEILTASGSLNRTVVTNDKIYWIRKHVDPKVIITATIKGEDKAAFARPSHVLIDDRKSNIKAWTQAGGIGVLHRTADDTINQLKSYLLPIYSKNLKTVCPMFP